MRRVFFLFALVCAIAGLTLSVTMAAPPPQKLNCFQGGGGACSVDSSNNTAILDVPSGGYAGVYVNGKSYSNKPLGSVGFSFTYFGDVSGGSPRLSIPINDGTSPTPYAFIDAAGCGYVSDVGVPNQFHTVSTTLTNCQVSFKSPNYNYANWDAFAAANPTFTISNGTLAFVIADQPGHDVIYSLTTK
jgi:hypothetical protein